LGKKFKDSGTLLRVNKTLEKGMQEKQVRYNPCNTRRELRWKKLERENDANCKRSAVSKETTIIRGAPIYSGIKRGTMERNGAAGKAEKRGEDETGESPVEKSARQ